VADGPVPRAGPAPAVHVRPARPRRLLDAGEDALLVAEAEHRLTAKGAVRISALVMSEHDPAVPLWRAAGYTHDPRVGRHVRSLR
jgi:hypothetical protein